MDLVYNQGMRVFIYFNDESGVKRTSRLHISNCTFTSQLINSICREIGVKKSYAIVKLKYEPYNLRIVEDWPISHYPIRSGSTFLVQFNQKYKYQDSESTQSLPKIQEVNDDPLSSYLSSHKKSFVSSKSEKDDLYLQECLERLIEAVKEGDLGRVAEIMKEEPNLDNQQELEKMMKKKSKYLVNQIGDGGKTALHEAVSCNNLDIASFLLIKGANSRTLTIDEYTILQLAIVSHSTEVLRAILDQNIVDINEVTSWGSALHLAVSRDDQDALQILLKYDADPEVSNRQGLRPFQICTNKKMKDLLKKKNDMHKLPIISILRGQVFEVTSYMHRHKQRMMLLNPHKQEVLFQNKSKQIKHRIHLKNIKVIEMISEKGWLMNADYFYFNIRLVGLNGDQIMVALKHEKTYLRWIKGFGNALQNFENSMFAKPIPLSDQTIEVINDDTNEITLHKRKLKQTDKTHPNEIPSKSSAPSQVRQPNYFLSIVNNEEESPLRTSVNSSNYNKESQVIPGSVIDFHSNMKTSSAQSDYSFPDVVEETFMESVIQAKQQEKEDISKNRFRKNSEKISPVSQFKLQEKLEISFKDFELLKQIGSGSFGQVYLAKHKKTEKVFALKVLSKKKLMAKKQLKYAVGQVNILKKMNSPFVITLYYAFQTPLHLYMVLDNCPNGDLSEVIIVREKLTESTACFILGQLILAVEYLHSKGILYRDMKPENILIAKDGYIKLTDFGLSKENCFSMSFCGSPAYLSPEMLQKKGVGFQSDIYGIGTVLYEMVVGEPPYYDDDMNVMFENIKAGKLLFPENLSLEVKSLICRLLERDVSKRLGAKDINEIKKHDFFKKLNWRDLMKKRILAPRELFVEEQDDHTFEPVSLQKKIKIEVGDSYEANTVMINRVKNFTFIRSFSSQNVDASNPKI